MDYAKVPVVSFPRLKHSISCANCHDPKTMKLRVINPAFIEAMKKRGIDTSAASQEDMRSYVCGQCHVEYYFRAGVEQGGLAVEKGSTRSRCTPITRPAFRLRSRLGAP